MQEYWKSTELVAWHVKQPGYGYDETITLEQLYQMFAQRMAHEQAERMLKMLKEG